MTYQQVFGKQLGWNILYLRDRDQLMRFVDFMTQEGDAGDVGYCGPHGSSFAISSETPPTGFHATRMVYVSKATEARVEAFMETEKERDRKKKSTKCAACAAMEDKARYGSRR